MKSKLQTVAAVTQGEEIDIFLIKGKSGDENRTSSQIFGRRAALHKLSYRAALSRGNR
ncbi:hypothetical protein AGR1A_Cc40009 [Agrobacterium fabacearum CFBP 5771]|nr:hypothetical protein AGR1A_Cc40009 [Agrobacterium fabacearum CFBP 5771]